METLHSGMLGLAVIASVFAGAAVLYQWIRSHFPVTVNCHFCNENTKVPYGNRDCWDCPSCEQYNGFTKDGHYNKEIPAQHNEDMNHPITAESRHTSSLDEATSPSILCDKCSRNQILKVKLLAHFVPHEESNFDAEVEAYQSHLEYEYRLCRQCDHKVSRSLATQDSKLQRNLDSSGLSTSGMDLNNTSYFQSPMYCRLPEFVVVRSLRAVIIILAVLVLCCDAYNMVQQSRLAWEPEGETAETLAAWMSAAYINVLGLTLVALCINVLAVYIAGRERLSQVDALSCLLWMGLLLLHTPSIMEKMDVSNILPLQTAISALTLTSTVFSALSPRYLKAASPKRIQKRSLRRHLRLDSSVASSLSYDTSPTIPSPPSHSPRSRADRSEYGTDLFTAPLPPRPREEAARPPPTPQLDEMGTLRIGTPVRERPPRRNGAFMFDFPNQASRNLLNAQTMSTPAIPMMKNLGSPRPIVSPARFTPVLTRHQRGSTMTHSPLLTSLQGQPGLGTSHNGLNHTNLFHSGLAGPVSEGGDERSVFSESRDVRSGEGSSQGTDSTNTRSSVCPVGTTSREDDNNRRHSPTDSKNGSQTWLLWLFGLVAVVSIVINISFFTRFEITPSWFTIDFSTFLFS